MAKSKRIEKPFTNQFGQIINVGDPVISITLCTGRTYLTRAKYVGVIESPGGRWEGRYPNEKWVPCIDERVQVAVTQDCTDWYRKDNDDICYTWECDESERYSKTTPITISTLNYNNILPDTVTVDELIKAV